MSYDIPQRYEPQIKQFAHAQHISMNEALERILQAGLEQVVPTDTKTVDEAPAPARTYASFFGSIKNGYGSPEAVDRAIEEMRNEW